LTLLAICGRNKNRRGRPCYVANPRKESEPMKFLWILAKVTALTLLMALGGTAAYAQAEIDPDHFDSPNTEPLDQPKTPQNQVSASRYDGNFSLPYAVQCSGKQLAPGKYSVSLRSDGKVGHGVLKSKSQFIEITSVVHPQGFKRDVVVVGSKGKVRTLSAIQILGVNFVFEIFKRGASSSSNNEYIETLPLTLVSFKSSQTSTADEFPTKF